MDQVFIMEPPPSVAAVEALLAVAVVVVVVVVVVVAVAVAVLVVIVYYEVLGRVNIRGHWRPNE